MSSPKPRKAGANSSRSRNTLPALVGWFSAVVSTFTLGTRPRRAEDEAWSTADSEEWR